MRAVVQRVTRAEVRIAGATFSRIGPGMLVLVGIGIDDTPESGEWLAEKIVNLRILDDDRGKMNRSILERDAESGAPSSEGILCVSQFTLYGDARKGRRPSYAAAARPEAAKPLYEAFLQSLRSRLPRAPDGRDRVQAGEFQRMCEVELVNDGPVTLLLDSERRF